MVKVKVEVMNLLLNGWIGRGDKGQIALKGFLHRLFVSFLVYKVHKICMAIGLDHTVEMRFEGLRLDHCQNMPCLSISFTHCFSVVHDLQIRLIPQVVDLCPEKRNTPSCLHEAQPLSTVYPSPSVGFSILRDRVIQDNLFRFIEIGDVAGGVDTSSEISGTGSVPRSSRDEKEKEIPRVKG